MQGFDDKTAMITAIAGGTVEHLRADAMQGAQIRVFRTVTPVQLDFDQTAQAEQGRVFAQLAFEKLERGVFTLLAQQPLRQSIGDSPAVIRACTSRR